jgi:hypothetical protein
MSGTGVEVIEEKRNKNKKKKHCLELGGAKMGHIVLISTREFPSTNLGTWCGYLKKKNQLYISFLQITA